MQVEFDSIIDTFLDTKVGIAQHFITNELASELKQHILLLHKKNLMKEAGTGVAASVMVSKAIRSDKIYWLDRLHNNMHENSFLDIIDSFVLFLNKTCYTGITGYEFHFTVYEKGSFYKKHIDQFKHNKDRAYSMIVYLNPNWEKADGGELCIHHEKNLQYISPENGKVVFFKSDVIEHEVLISNTERISITGWFKTN
jgi:SM-20-related protein